MITVIPDPVHCRLLGGDPVSLRSGIRLRGTDSRLHQAFERFLDDTAADGTNAVRRDDDAAIELALTLKPEATLSLPAAAGLAASGGDPDGERYALRVREGRIEIEAPTPEGIFRGLTTLRQLLAAPSIPNLEIIDGPRFAWRGLTMDLARTFFDATEITRVVDIMSLYKLNLLHLHLTDDPGWRIEIPAYPLLTEIGGRGALGDRPGGHLSLADYTDIVHYARDRFVTVVPEVDMPGHSGAVLSAYPNLARPSLLEGLPPNLLDPDKPEVVTFVGEVLATVVQATPGPYIHIGGDEAFGMDSEAYDRFMTMSRDMVRSLGKTPLSWQESARSSNGPGDILQFWQAFDPALESVITTGRFDELPLPENMSIPAEILPVIAEQFRNSRSELDSAIQRGARVILSPASHLYLDRAYQEPSIESAQSRMQQDLGLKIYEPRRVEDFYDWDPGSWFPGKEQAVAGVGAAIWCETITTPEELEFLLLPRLPGVAERAWSPAPGRAWPEYAKRLAFQGGIWTERSWTYFESSLVPWQSLPLRSQST